MSELSEAEREALEDAAGCGCCSSKTSAEILFPDDCPKEDGYVDHDYRAGCIQMASVGDIAQRILTARLAAVEALAAAWEAVPPSRIKPAFVVAAHELRVALGEVGL